MLMNEETQLYIIVPVYNSSKYILEFIDKIYKSISDLKMLDKAYIVFCDDASTDKTVDVIQKEMKKYSLSFKILQQTKNIGHHDNTLMGILSCPINNYCLTIDADMQPSPEVLKSFIPYCMKSNKYLVVGDFNPYNWGMRSFVSFVYNIILSVKIQRNLIRHHGSSLRWIYLNEELKSKLNQDRIDVVLLKYHTAFDFYNIDKKFLLNRSQHSLLELVKNIFTSAI